MPLSKAAGIAVRSLTPNIPYHVQWMLTRKCNFRCKGCNVWQEQDARELPTEKVKQGLDILHKLGVMEVVLSGGNPLLRDDIGEIIEYASRFFITTVYDNGSMAAKKIDALRHADFVAISIDSLNPEKNDYARGVKNAWKNSVEAVEKLHEEGINVSVSPTISQFNLNEIEDFTRYFVSREIPIWYALYSFDACDQDQLFKIGKENNEFSITDMQTFANLCETLIHMKKQNSNILMTTRVLKALKSLYLTGKRNWKCRALQNFFVIDHLGRVAGCHVHSSAATIFDLPKVWNSQKFNDLRKAYRQCSQCTYMCYVFYSIHGSVLGNLKIAQEQWKNAGVLLRRKSVKVPNLAEQR
ncbi:MAG TPA: radical SAM protein [Candidatus Bathyarchaeia archaeon]|nr:radical SAM protein [Candidatus Bathyarchaeia archaeon]